MVSVQESVQVRLIPATSAIVDLDSQHPEHKALLIAAQLLEPHDGWGRIHLDCALALGVIEASYPEELAFIALLRQVQEQGFQFIVLQES